MNKFSQIPVNGDYCSHSANGSQCELHIPHGSPTTGSHTTLVHLPHWFTYHMVHTPREYDSHPGPWNPPTALNNQSKFCTLDIFSLKIETKTNQLHAAGRKSKFPEFKGFSTLSMKGVMVVDAFSVQSFDRWECADDKSVRSNKSGGSPR